MVSPVPSNPLNSPRGSTSGSSQPLFNSEGIDGRVRKRALSHFDEFSAPEPLVATVLTAEAAGVAKNALLIPAAVVPAASHAALGIGAGAGACYFIAGAIMVWVGKLLLPACFADLKNAMKNPSFDEKWRSSLNFTDKCLLISIGAASCFIGAMMIVTLSSALAAIAASAISAASIVFAALVTIRGGEMMLRGGYGLWKGNQFQKIFEERSQAGAAIQWLYEEKSRDEAALKNRIGQEGIDALNQALSLVDLSRPIDEQLIERKVYEDFRKSIDRAACEERVKQQLISSIGTVMFLGGVLSLVAIALSHGAASSLIVTALGIAGSGLSLSMEALWMPYDNPKWFKKCVEWSYRMQELKRPLSAVPSERALKI